MASDKRGKYLRLIAAQWHKTSTDFSFLFYSHSKRSDLPQKIFKMLTAKKRANCNPACLSDVFPCPYGSAMAADSAAGAAFNSSMAELGGMVTARLVITIGLTGVNPFFSTSDHFTVHTT